MATGATPSSSKASRGPSRCGRLDLPSRSSQPLPTMHLRHVPSFAPCWQVPPNRLHRIASKETAKAVPEAIIRHLKAPTDASAIRSSRDATSYQSPDTLFTPSLALRRTSARTLATRSARRSQRSLSPSHASLAEATRTLLSAARPLSPARPRAPARNSPEIPAFISASSPYNLPPSQVRGDADRP